MQKPLSILVIAGHDPTGGAGIQADIETINDLGGHASCIITALTVQNSHNLQAFSPVDTKLIEQQLNLLATDLDFAAVKIGMLVDSGVVDVVARFLQQLPSVPLILDPVLAAGGGGITSTQHLRAEIMLKLLPLCRVVTPNLPEARLLTGKMHPDDCAGALLATGCRHVIITGSHDETADIVHRLYSRDGTNASLHSPRLAGEYHGSGCTFASALSFFLASTQDINHSLQQAQAYTLNSLKHAHRPGHGQHFPARQQGHWPDD